MFGLFTYYFKQGHSLLQPPRTRAARGACTDAEGEPRRPAARAILSVILTSDFQDNRCRFEKFCKLLGEATGMENGFDAIEIEYPRSSMRGMRHKTSNLRIRYDLFEGRDVILFDDVHNTGIGFLQLADALSGYGRAASLTGILLGRCVDPDLP